MCLTGADCGFLVRVLDVARTVQAGPPDSIASLMLLRLLPALMAALACIACVGPPRHPRSAAAPRRIELLGFSGCPNTPTMRRNLQQALRTIDPTLRFDDVDQESLSPADLRRGYPTPTVLVDGKDLYDLPIPEGPAMGCRFYPAGVPGPDDIARRLRQRLAIPR